MARKLTPAEHNDLANAKLAELWPLMKDATLSEKIAYAQVQATLALYPGNPVVPIISKVAFA